MKPEQMTEALEQAATQLGVQVRYDTMTGDAAGGGGLCKVKGAWWVIIDRKMPPAERAAMLIEALAGFDTDACSCPPPRRRSPRSAASGDLSRSRRSLLPAEEAVVVMHLAVWCGPPHAVVLGLSRCR